MALQGSMAFAIDIKGGPFIKSGSCIKASGVFVSMAGRSPYSRILSIWSLIALRVVRIGPEVGENCKGSAALKKIIHLL